MDDQMKSYDAMKERFEDDARKRIEDMNVQQKAQRTGMRMPDPDAPVDMYGRRVRGFNQAGLDAFTAKEQAAARARARAASMATGIRPSKAAQRAAMSDASKRGMKGVNKLLGGAEKLLGKVGGPAGYALGALGVKEVYDRVKSGELDPNALVEMLDPLFLGPSQTLVSGDQERAEIASAVREAERQAAIDELAGPDFLTTDEDVLPPNRARLRRMN